MKKRMILTGGICAGLAVLFFLLWPPTPYGLTGATACQITGTVYEEELTFTVDSPLPLARIMGNLAGLELRHTGRDRLPADYEYWTLRFTDLWGREISLIELSRDGCWIRYTGGDGFYQITDGTVDWDHLYHCSEGDRGSAQPYDLSGAMWCSVSTGGATFEIRDRDNLNWLREQFAGLELELMAEAPWPRTSWRYAFKGGAGGTVARLSVGVSGRFLGYEGRWYRITRGWVDREQVRALAENYEEIVIID